MSALQRIAKKIRNRKMNRFLAFRFSIPSAGWPSMVSAGMNVYRRVFDPGSNSSSVTCFFRCCRLPARSNFRMPLSLYRSGLSRLGLAGRGWVRFNISVEGVCRLAGFGFFVSDRTDCMRVGSPCSYSDSNRRILVRSSVIRASRSRACRSIPRDFFFPQPMLGLND